MTRTAVVALGGNALTRPGQAGSYDEKCANAAATAAAVEGVLDAGWRAVIVHGNGPQVGNLAIQQEATDMVPAQPLSLLGAMTQGELGSIVGQAVDSRCGAGTAVPVVTHVRVDRDDPAFDNPTKPIGRFFDRAEADRLTSERGWTMRAETGYGYRRVVPSPEPVDIVESDAIRALVSVHPLVIAAGGGGVPVVTTPQGYAAVDAVIDKDRAAQLLANAIPATALLLVTAVEAAFLDYGTAQQRPLRRVSADEAQRYHDEGQFPAGSMGPKVAAALQFLRNGGETAVITTPQLLAEALADPESGVGTRIERSPRQLDVAR